MSGIALFLNKDRCKNTFERININKTATKYKVQYHADTTLETIKNSSPTTFLLDTYHDVLDYIEDILDMLIEDCDVYPYESIDVIVPGYPIVCLKNGNAVAKGLLISVVRSWMKRTYK